ncbi:unnamed protein product [Rotaria magnacalcarata]|uniref:Uncharacterized protein n=2 Tax=Rotaria magnacalcarata TaxID=392030 RepID=A0A816ZZL5_9BILA|nr:unnamed protein product [Rotaria magnacalcarata]
MTMERFSSSTDIVHGSLVLVCEIGQSTGDWGFMNKVESTIGGMTTGERNAPNIGQRGGLGSMLNELESMAGDGGSSGDGGMTNEIEKIVKNEFF